MNRQRGRSAALVVGLLLAGIWVSASATEPATVAYVKSVFPRGTKFGQALKVVRDGQQAALADGACDLRAGDRVFVRRGAVSIFLVATAEQITVAEGDGGADQPDFIVPQPPSPPSSGLVAMIRALMNKLDRGGMVVAVTRGAGEPCYNPIETSAPTSFDMPVLFADHPLLAAGKRALFVSWKGGRPPFDVQLVDAKNNKAVTSANVQAACCVRLSPVTLSQGEYRLSVKDANGSSLSEDHLTVGGAPPTGPRELSDASLSADARRLYTASWLVSAENGRWAFEAQQRVAEAGCPSPAARQWLERWGSAPACGKQP